MREAAPRRLWPSGDPLLYLVTDPSMRGSEDLPGCVLKALEGGVRLVQYRAKGIPWRTMMRDVEMLLEVCRPRGVPLIVNDSVELALACGCDGVHLGQSDATPELARGTLGEAALVGLTVTCEREALEAAPEADYLGLSAVFATSTKADAPKPMGTEGIRRIRRVTDLPLIAIGGIDPDNAASCIAAGADGVAVVSAIMDSPDPRGAAGRLLRAISGATGAPSG